jgi:hypothetical protein
LLPIDAGYGPNLTLQLADDVATAVSRVSKL